MIAKPLRVDEDELVHESSTNVRPQFVNEARVSARLNNLAESQILHRGLRLRTSTPQLHVEGPPILAEVVPDPDDPCVGGPSVWGALGPARPITGRSVDQRPLIRPIVRLERRERAGVPDRSN